jgi:hypothetical protein
MAEQLRIASHGLKHCAGWNINEDKRNALLAVALECDRITSNAIVRGERSESRSTY